MLKNTLYRHQQQQQQQQTILAEHLNIQLHMKLVACTSRSQPGYDSVPPQMVTINEMTLKSLLALNPDLTVSISLGKVAFDNENNAEKYSLSTSTTTAASSHASLAQSRSDLQ